ncbi:MAG: hypothetical protein J0M35_20210 [Candidatus Obscuribacter phosphatis]|uniref:Uncharacterized protein n=1 Tax=Candidatus Obscuribacter phosphatis TaxID=1906157 RepID=A0A8J7PLG3_9BACT|nr:hypothetical protein [Candidatus Obscuribacter phosphatis]
MNDSREFLLGFATFALLKPRKAAQILASPIDETLVVIISYYTLNPLWTNCSNAIFICDQRMGSYLEHFAMVNWLR